MPCRVCKRASFTRVALDDGDFVFDLCAEYYDIIGFHIEMHEGGDCRKACRKAYVKYGFLTYSNGRTLRFKVLRMTDDRVNALGLCGDLSRLIFSFLHDVKRCT